MIALAERKQVALQQKIDSLRDEFCQWRMVTEESAEFEKHQTQVIALTGHLEGLWQTTQDLFAEARSEKTVLADSRNIESLLLGLRRIWEFFRSKLVQRRDPSMRPFLQAADELAWACYRPVLDRYPAARRQPPLVFLNGGLSPYALSRDQAFVAESVPGETLGGATYDPILQHLPFAMIGVPWHQVAHLPDLPVVAHETGHAVENDFKLLPFALVNIETELGTGSPHLAHWKAWSREVFADLWGCLTLGPAYASSLADFLASGRVEIDNEIASELGKYPTTHLRIVICIEALERLGFAIEASNLETQWRSEYAPATMARFEDDVPKVVEAILAQPLAGSLLDQPLLQFEDLRLTVEKWGWAQHAAQQLTENDPPTSATTIVTWAAAARDVYDRSPSKYASEAFGDSLLARSKELIKPGTRAGEATADDEAKSDLLLDSRQAAIEWFEDFARWSSAILRDSDPGPKES